METDKSTNALTRFDVEKGPTAVYISNPCGCGARAIMGFRENKIAIGCTECDFHTKFYPVEEFGNALDEWDKVREAAAVFKDL